MSQRALIVLAASCLLLALLGILFIDHPLAAAVHRSGIESATWVVRGREFFDIFTGKGLVGAHTGLGEFLLGGVLIAVGLVWLIARRASLAARGLIFAGAVQWITIEAGWLIKGAFGRARPLELLKHGDWSHGWFAGGNSFPSGHNDFFWGVCLPLAYVFPKWRVPLLMVPVFIGFARIDENYHFLSDVLAAIALAALITLLATVLLGRWVKPLKS